MQRVARRLHADPEFKAATAERMRRLNADPEFKAATAERMRRLNADPEFKAATAERMRRLHADRRGFDIPSWVPDDLRDDFIDVALLEGEERAASFVRRLKAEARP